jgi:hypothetical protein
MLTIRPTMFYRNYFETLLKGTTMQNEQTQINEAPPLTAEEIVLINELLCVAEQVRNLVERVAKLPAAPLAETDGPPTVTTDPIRAIEIARAELQVGFMWLRRAIARPTTF